jgi:hypothetical protein
MKLKIEVLESAAGARVIVDGNMEGEKNYENGTTIIVESGSVVEVRELGLVDATPPDTPPSSGD